MPAFYKEWFYRARLSLMAKVITKPQPRPALYVGPDSSLQLCNTIARFGVKKLLIVTDKPLVELGVLAAVLARLEERSVPTQIYDGVQPDPTQKVVNDGIALLKDSGCDAVLAFGGGSSIDCAKVIALAAGNDCSAADCLGANKTRLPPLPFFAIPTTAGTGSEATFIAVISDDETHAKDAVIDAKLIPRAAALDPVLMQGLPAAITAATGMDALTHAIESYIGTWETPDTNFYGLAASRLVFENLARACSHPEDLEAREAMALASYYGGLAITNALVGYVHAVSHNLGAMYGVPHGLGNAIVLPRVLELMREAASGRLAEIAVYCGFGEASEGEAALCQKLIERVTSLNAQIGIPECIDVIKAQDIEKLADAALAEGSSYPTPRFLERAECIKLVQDLRAA
jgi:alcohol dehydrogenase